ncbi:MAG: deoxyribose-phosphate aldolase [Nitrospirota bacterium]
MNIAKLIDHTLLRPDATETEIFKLCEDAKQYGFFSVCIHPSFIKTAKELLTASPVKISTVTGFPLGATLTNVKIYEAIESVIAGADELDIVINTGHAKSGNWKAVEKEISGIINATPQAVHKIIIETCCLTDDEKKTASSVVINTGAEFIKTSTGFGPSGAKVSDIKIINSVTKGKIGIKAAGGIKKLEDAIALINAGATRIGTSSGVEIMNETL